MKHELVDIFDDHERMLGTATRQEAHEKGHWHRTFHCWIVSNRQRPTLLFQKRHMSKDVFPGKLDKSAAGHLLAGESPEDGLRELEEELGIKRSIEELSFLGKVQVENITDDMNDREFCYVYMTESEQHIETYQVQTSEVSGLYEVKVSDYQDLVEGRVEQIRAAGAEWDAVAARWIRNDWLASSDDFTPQNEAYYRLLFGSIAKMTAD